MCNHVASTSSRAGGSERILPHQSQHRRKNRDTYEDDAEAPETVAARHDVVRAPPPGREFCGNSKERFRCFVRDGGDGHRVGR